MRKEVKEIELYTFNELSADAKEVAIRHIQEDKLHAFNEWTSNEFATSIARFLERFNCSHGDMYIDLYSPSYIEVLTGNYFEQTNEERNRQVEWLNDNIESGSDGSCPFTGVYTDCYVFDYFTRENRKTSYNTLHKDIVEAVDYALDTFLDTERENIEDESECERYADDTDFEFTSDGERYIG